MILRALCFLPCQGIPRVFCVSYLAWFDMRDGISTDDSSFPTYVEKREKDYEWKWREVDITLNDNKDNVLCFVHVC